MCLDASSININKPAPQKRVLVSPLDWGLGHATRCVPLIRELLAQGFYVLIAAEKNAAAVLSAEFPTVKILPIHGYGVRYSRRRQFFFLKMLFQSGKIRSAIKKEHSLLKKLVAEEHIDIIISDNRFGLCHKDVYCIFITHQLFIKTGNRFTEKIAQKINYRYINHFNECWVPDAPGSDNLAGALSHPAKMPGVPVRYIGGLSRFMKSDREKNIDILAIVSGPEPQRTIFEALLLKQLSFAKGKNMLLRGLPASGRPLQAGNEHLQVFDHLPAAIVNDAMLSAKVIIAAGGYSTVMDLAALQKNAILLPTPGQSEQEYLAEYLSGKNYCIAADRGNFDPAEMVKKFNSASFASFPPGNEMLLKNAVHSLR